MLDYIKERDHILNLVGNESAVIDIPLAGQFEAARGDIIALDRGNEPSNERFNHQVEKEGREWVPLNGPPSKPHR